MQKRVVAKVYRSSPIMSRLFQLPKRAGTWLFIVFPVLILAFPSINQLLTPCLKHVPGFSYEYNECNILLTLDRFLLLSLTSLTIFVLYSFLRWKKRSLSLALGIYCAIIVIVAYHVYIPVAEREIRTSAIYLDSIPNK